MIKRLKKRFILIVTAAVTAVMTLLFILVNTVNYASVNSDICNTLRVISENQGRMPSAPPDERPDDKPADRMNEEKKFTTRYFVLKYDDDGTLSQALLDNIAAVTEDDTDKYLDIALKHGQGFGYTNGYKYYVVSNGEDRNMAVFLDCSQQIHGIVTTAVITAAGALFCIGLVCVIVIFLSRKAINPIVEGYEKQKRFITDASHELKTPITVISASLKVLEMETGPNKWIDKIGNQNEKLKELVNSLVTLARMDEGQSQLKLEEFNISEAVRETAESFCDFALSNGHKLNVETEPNVIYKGNEYSIRQLVSILADNAVKYADENSEIFISMKSQKKGIVITCRNECKTATQNDTAHLFDRFYRADKSRSTEGFGIGLSIAKGIAESHKGSIKAKLNDGVIEFTAELK